MTISFNSSKSDDIEWSRNFEKFLSIVKCFSIIFAPIEAANKHASFPIVWSEYPTIKSSFLFKILIEFKLALSSLTG